jgi:hypothetical protein
MAKLPYTITICPDEPNPKQFTALTPAVVRALRYTNDLTIDQRQDVYPCGTHSITQINTHKEKNSTSEKFIQVSDNNDA